MNSTGRNGAAIFIRSALVRGFADRYFPGPGERRSVDAQTAREHARLMAGSYRSSRRADYSFFNLAPLISPIEVKLGENDGLVIPQITGLDGQPLLWQEVQPFVWHEIGGKERLAAKLEDGEVVAFSMDSVSPYLVFQRVDWWRSPRGLVPLLALAFGAILLSVAMWPIGAIVRSWHGVAFPLTGREAKACRLVRIAGIASFAIGVAWLYLLTLVSTNPFVFSPPLDPWMLSLRVMTLVVFAGGVGAVGWFAWLAWSARRSRASRTGRAALVWSFLVLLWTAVVFELVGLSVSY
jgi:hypothetical protein